MLEITYKKEKFKLKKKIMYSIVQQYHLGHF